jgi:hypothetical protein
MSVGVLVRTTKNFSTRLIKLIQMPTKISIEEEENKKSFGNRILFNIVITFFLARTQKKYSISIVLLPE